MASSSRSGESTRPLGEIGLAWVEPDGALAQHGLGSQLATQSRFVEPGVGLDGGRVLAGAGLRGDAGSAGRVWTTQRAESPVRFAPASGASTLVTTTEPLSSTGLHRNLGSRAPVQTIVGLKDYNEPLTSAAKVIDALFPPTARDALGGGISKAEVMPKIAVANDGSVFVSTNRTVFLRSSDSAVFDQWLSRWNSTHTQDVFSYFPARVPDFVVPPKGAPIQLRDGGDVAIKAARDGDRVFATSLYYQDGDVKVASELYGILVLMFWLPYRLFPVAIDDGLLSVASNWSCFWLPTNGMTPDKTMVAVSADGLSAWVGWQHLGSMHVAKVAASGIDNSQLGLSSWGSKQLLPPGISPVVFLAPKGKLPPKSALGGRGNMEYSSGDRVWIAFSDDTGVAAPYAKPSASISEYRVYLALIAPDTESGASDTVAPLYWCIDHFSDSPYADGDAATGYPAIHDPDLVIDETLGVVIIVYPLADPNGRKRIGYAVAAIDQLLENPGNVPWTYGDVWPAASRDQGQPAIALDRDSHRVAITWYQRVFDAPVSFIGRFARTFQITAEQGDAYDLVPIDDARNLKAAGENAIVSDGGFVVRHFPESAQEIRTVFEFQAVAALRSDVDGYEWLSVSAAPDEDDSVLAPEMRFRPWSVRWR